MNFDIQMECRSIVDAMRPERWYNPTDIKNRLAKDISAEMTLRQVQWRMTQLAKDGVLESESHQQFGVTYKRSAHCEHQMAERSKAPSVVYPRIYASAHVTPDDEAMAGVMMLKAVLLEHGRPELPEKPTGQMNAAEQELAFMQAIEDCGGQAGNAEISKGSGIAMRNLNTVAARLMRAGKVARSGSGLTVTWSLTDRANKALAAE